MLTPPREEREKLWNKLTGVIEEYAERIGRYRVTPDLDVEILREEINEIDFSGPVAPTDALDWVAARMWKGQVHTAHPRYYGLFNPNPATMGVAADTLVAAFNPQMAAWSHNPFACEIEQHLIRCFGEKFGYSSGSIAGSFTAGGMEANHTAVLTALVKTFPDYATRGACDLGARPALYVSRESHHSLLKAARLCGIGTDAVTMVSLDDKFVMDCDDLQTRIVEDRRKGRLPFMVVATAGTTNAGLIDPVGRIADVAQSEGIWLHADAAWGGAAVLCPELKPALDGIERADSITFDAHKWLSVPMGAGMFLTRHVDLPRKTFAIATDYMPVTADRDVIEPHLTTMQWSRRFIGLKVFMSLLVAGWKGYEETIRRQTAMGTLLRETLGRNGWEVVNDTPLPTVCFVDSRGRINTPRQLAAVVDEIVGAGKAWISTTSLGGTTPVIRACITNHRTGPDDIDALVNDLNDARSIVVQRSNE